MNSPKNIGNNESSSDRKLKEQFGNKTPFQVPEGYFEELPGKVLDACKSSDAKTQGVRFLSIGYRRLAVAATILLFVASAITIVFMNNTLEEDALLEYSNSELYQYNINSLLDLEESYLFSLVEDDSLKSIKLLDDELDDVSDDIIIEYLLADNHIEYYINNEY